MWATPRPGRQQHPAIRADLLPVQYGYSDGDVQRRPGLDGLDASQLDTDGTLIAAGYVPSSGRGTVSASVSGGGSSSTNTAWTVLADNHTELQFTNVGSQYWDANDNNGNVQLTGVAPGTYRLSSYVLGQWESRA